MGAPESDIRPRHRQLESTSSPILLTMRTFLSNNEFYPCHSGSGLGSPVVAGRPEVLILSAWPSSRTPFRGIRYRRFSERRQPATATPVGKFVAGERA